MRPTRKTLAALTPVFALSLLGVGMSAAPASASTAAGCSGYSCHGYDLYHFGCTYNISTSAAAEVNGVVLAYVYNRYSSGCNANWTEAQITAAGHADGDSIWAETFTYTPDSHGTNEVMYSPTNYGNQGLLDEPGSAPYAGTSSVYTDMVDGTNKVCSDVIVYHGTTEVQGAETCQ